MPCMTGNDFSKYYFKKISLSRQYNFNISRRENFSGGKNTEEKKKLMFLRDCPLYKAKDFGKMFFVYKKLTNLTIIAESIPV